MSAVDVSDVVREYFRRMREADPSVVDLFAEDAQLIGLGNRVVGAAAIAEFYGMAQKDAGAEPDVVSVASAGDRVFAELFVRLPDSPPVHVVDVFSIKDGRIATLTYFVADYPS